MNPESTQRIVAALTAGNPQEAERLCRAQLHGKSDDEDGLLLLAMSLHGQGRQSEAITVYRRLAEIFPGSSLHQCNYATALRGSGLLQEADAAYAEAIRLDPSNPGPKLELGLMRIGQRDYLAARELLLDAFELDRQSPMLRIQAARACSLCQDFQGAQDLLKPWQSWLPLQDDDLQMELARQLNLLSDTPASAALLEDVLQRNPAMLEARMLLAGIYERLNRLDEAGAMLEAIARLAASAPDAGIENEAGHLRATLALRAGDAASARASLERLGPRHANDYTHYFELAKACDKLGETAAAMQALRAAHAIQAEELRHAAPEHFEPGASALPALVPRINAEAFARWPKLVAPETRDSPVFIVGFPRSGTTLLEQMLDAHPGLQSMDENPFFNRLADKLRNHHEGILSNLGLLQQRDCDELRKRYLVMVAETIPRRWDAQLVDKNPLNMMWVPLIHRLFPAAKFILALRHPCDVVLSCYMQNFRSSILGAACASLERLAAAYVQAMGYWLEDERIFRPQVLVSRYEDLVADPVTQTRRIADFLELADAAPMLQFDRHARDKGYIATPSYTQVIEPVNRKGMNRWLRYRREFEPVLPILEPMLRHWGYASDVAGDETS